MDGLIIMDSFEARAIVARYYRAEAKLLEASKPGTPWLVRMLAVAAYQQTKRLYDSLPRYRKAA